MLFINICYSTDIYMAKHRMLKKQLLHADTWSTGFIHIYLEHCSWYVYATSTTLAVNVYYMKIQDSFKQLKCTMNQILKFIKLKLQYVYIMPTHMHACNNQPTTYLNHYHTCACWNEVCYVYKAYCFDELILL